MEIRYVEYENGTWAVEREEKGWFRTRWVRMTATYWKDSLAGVLWYVPTRVSIRSINREYRTRFKSEEEARDIYEKAMHLEEDRKRAGRVRRIVK